MGRNGKGAAEHFGVEHEIDIQMGTLSKAAGSFGAYCCGSKDLISYLINKARSFIYTTAMPPSVAGASLRSLEIIRQQPKRRNQLWENTEYMTRSIKNMGFDTMDSCTPIIPILIKDSDAAVEFSKRLFEEGIYVSAIRPPTVPRGQARLRLTVMATHTQEQLDYASEQIKKQGKALCLI